MVHKIMFPPETMMNFGGKKIPLKMIEMNVPPEQTQLLDVEQTKPVKRID